MFLRGLRNNDALGRRMMKYDAIADETLYYYYNDQWQVLAEYDGNDVLSAYTVFGNYIDETLMRVAYDGPAFVGAFVYAHDHLYSTAAMVNFDAADATDIVERYEYDAYGEVTILNAQFSILNASQDANPYTFTGRRLDVLDGGDLNIMYYRNRYYSSEMGRFMTHDPLGIKPDDLQDDNDEEGCQIQYVDGYNTYQYVTSNPLSHTDPHGKMIGRIVNCGKCFAGWLPALARTSERINEKREECDSMSDPCDAKDCQEELGDLRKEILKDELGKGGILKACVKCGIYSPTP